MNNGVKKTPTFYTIGEMSKICGVSIKTLRYYQDIKLLEPENVDVESGYRYYSEKQIGQMGIILGLKKSGYSFSEIKEFLNHGDIDFLEAKLKERILRLDNEIKFLNQQKEHVLGRLKFFEKARQYKQKRLEGKHEPEIRFIAERKVVFIRNKALVSLGEVSSRFIRIMQIADAQNLNIREHFLVFHEPVSGQPGEIVDFEACILIEGEVPDCPYSRIIPANNYVVFSHEGERKEALEVLENMKKWFRENPYKPVGPLEIVYLLSYFHTKSSTYSVSDVQIPVQKIK